jgi:hypothetical protein
MITRIANKGQVADIFANTKTYVGLSTDTKPTDAKNADAFLEMNTGKVFLFDEDNATWIEQEN